MQVLTNNNLRELYEIDDDLWLEETVKLLKEKRFQELDLDNLIEELEELGKSQYLAVRSWLYRIIIHVLLLEYWTVEYERNYRHWRSEIRAFRFDLKGRLTTNLQNKLEQDLPNIYDNSVKYVQEKTGLKSNIFPKNCPYSLTQLLDEDFLP